MLLILLISYLSSLYPLPPEDNLWLLDYHKAIEVAQSKDRPIMMVFTGSDWCKNCIALEKEVFQDNAFIEYANENLVLLRVDFPRSKKDYKYKMDEETKSKLAEKYNPQGTFPFIVLISQDEASIASSGYRKGGWQSYQDFLVNHLPKP